MRTLLSFSGIFLFFISVNAQNRIADSLLKTIENGQNDSARYINRILYTQAVRYVPELAEPVLMEGIAEAKEKNDFLFLGELNHSLGIMYANSGETGKAKTCFETSLNYRITLKDTLGMASSYLALSNISRNVGNYDDAVSYALESERIYEVVGQHDGQARVCNSLGLIFRELGDTEKSLNYFRKGIRESEHSKDTRIKTGLMENMGGVFLEADLYDSALYFHKEAHRLRLESGSQSSLGQSYGNLGLVYMKTGELDSAQVYLETALDFFRQYDYREGMAEAYLSLGDLWRMRGNFTRAISAYKTGENFSEESGLYPLLVDISHGLGIAYSKVGNYKASSEYLQQYIVLKDSLFGYEQSAEVQKREIAFQFQKKELADSLKEVEQKKIEKLEADKKQQLDDARLARQKQFTVFGIVGFTGVLIFAFYLLRNNKQQRKLNEIIVEQKFKVEEKNREITDSINYAKRIQEAILPPRKLIEKYFPDSFVFYKPKDIVAGDFYWMEQHGEWYFIAAADCTGHGVPGAMVSVVCANALNRTVKEFNILDPGEILDKVRELVIATFEKSHHDVKDGMDISLCAIHSGTLELKWAGANNPLWVLKGKNIRSVEEILDLSPNRQPVGKYDKQMPFTTVKLQLQKDDSLYLFTDGYVDQFGGTDLKKFKARRLKELILRNSRREMKTQLEELASSFESWKGDCEQIDDVCVIGLKI